MSSQPSPRVTSLDGARGYHIAYRADQVNHCPGCGRSHWHVGRLSAECAFCGTALPLEDTQRGGGLFRTSINMRAAA